MFDIKARGSTVGREVVGGVTTFMAMSYILFVQPALLFKAGMDSGGVFMATCISSAGACLLMGILANYPIALAPGMGENFFFVFTLCGVSAVAGAFRLNWQEALALTVLTGVVFMLLSIVGFRARVLNAIPDALKSGIAAGIGLFIALIGFEWGNLVNADPVTGLKLAPMGNNFVAGLTLLGLGVTLALTAFRIRGAILLGILITTACTWAVGKLPVRPDLGLTVVEAEQGLVVENIALCSPAAQGEVIEKGDVLIKFGGREVHTADDLASAWDSARDSRRVEVELLRKEQKMLVQQPLDIRTIEFQGLVDTPSGLGRTAGGMVGGFGSLWSKLFSKHWLDVIIFAFILLFMDMFDTVGTLIGVSRRAGLMRNGALPKAERALAADAAGTVIGGVLGTSTVTSYIESVTGVEAGARTGLAAIVAGLCMLAALAFQPLVEMVGGGVIVGRYDWGDRILRYPMIAPALIMVGALMMRAIRDVQWDDITEGLPAFLTMVTMAFAYSISAGIAIGFVSYAFGKLVTGRARQCPLMVYVFAVLFVLRYIIAP